jgi:[ribosomal protein S5]-alanine N-acetyltransferase
VFADFPSSVLQPLRTTGVSDEVLQNIRVSRLKWRQHGLRGIQMFKSLLEKFASHPPLPSLRIETERLWLRAFDPQRDVERYSEITFDEAVQRFMAPHPKCSTEVLRRTMELKNLALSSKPRPLTSFAVHTKDDAQLIGTISLTRDTSTSEFGYLGFFYAPAAWGRGFATEAAEGMLDFGFERDAYKLIIAGATPENLACHKVLGKIGMRAIVPEEEFPGAPPGVTPLAFAMSQRCWQRRNAGFTMAPAFETKAMPGSFQNPCVPYAEIFACLTSAHCAFCQRDAETVQLWTSEEAAICRECVALLNKCTKLPQVSDA